MLTNNLGYPRIGSNRALKKASEEFLAGKSTLETLVQAGEKIIQIDEPGIRAEMLLQEADWSDYLQWTLRAFRISASVQENEIKIHSDRCFSEFNDILENIADRDANVVTMEYSHLEMELLDAFAGFKYPSEIGPVGYGIHSPGVPSKDELVLLLEKARAVIPAAQLWGNPDCGLKTRHWEETKKALIEMAAAAKVLREYVEEAVTL